MHGSNLIETDILCFQGVWCKTDFLKVIRHKKLYLIKLKMICFLLFKLKVPHTCYFVLILQEEFYIYTYMHVLTQIHLLC